MNGTSLHDNYTKLWGLVNDYKDDVMRDNISVNSSFKDFYNHPFSEVAGIMTQEMRENLTRTLGLGFSPYTQRQAASIYNLRNRYPTKVEDIKTVKTILDLLEKRYECKNQCDKVTLVKTINKVLCTLDQKYLWIVSGKVYKYYNSLSGEVEHKEVEAALEYLTEYSRLISKDKLQELDAQFIDDVTNLIPFTYPHPEVYLAFTNALLFIELYYGSIKGSKLFSTDVVGIMKRYLLRFEENPGLSFLEKFRLYEINNNKAMSEKENKTEDCGCTKFPTVSKESVKPNPTIKQCVKDTDTNRRDRHLSVINHKLVTLEIENIRLKNNLKNIDNKANELVAKAKVLDTIEPVTDFEGNVIFSAFKAN